jgi:hypothetical protein
VLRIKEPFILGFLLGKISESKNLLPSSGFVRRRFFRSEEPLDPAFEKILKEPAGSMK